MLLCYCDHVDNDKLDYDNKGENNSNSNYDVTIVECNNMILGMMVMIMMIGIK